MSDRFVAWEGAYRGDPPPWDIGRPQPVVVRIADANGFRSPVLDAGCGTGENALYLASRGLAVVGIDGATLAIDRALAKARDRGLAATFRAGDALALGSLELVARGRTFASVLDCGLFHTFDDRDRATYVESLAAVTGPGAVLHLLCFSNEEPWGGGPRRIHQDEIRSAFAEGWTVTSIEPGRFATRLHDDGARAWHATIERSG
jgi:SAM-dependent methyltransferase